MYKLNLKNKIPICLFLALTLTLAYSQNCEANDQQQCQKCKGFYWYANSCQQCSFATTEYKCELCPGFYFKDNICQSCNQITNPALCQQCSGYFFSAQQCQPCDFASAYLCILECPNYYLRSGICTRCSEARDQLTCKNCVASFQFKENKCVQCPKHYINNDVEYQCMPCLGLNEARLCSNCPQFYFSNSSCHFCKSATDAKSCMLCSGFYFNGTNCNHCNEATQSSCMSCPNHIFINGFCTPCRLISDNTLCQNCPLFRYSTDRKMCVPCQQRGFYLSSNNTCVHCSRSRSKDTCTNCPGYMFDSLYNVCSNCSQIINELKCKQCPSYFYSNSSNRCISCKDADLLQCLIYCDNFFFKNKCVNCQQATSLAECRRCSFNFYWSSSRQCLPCKGTDYFRKNNQCLPCSAAKNADQCSYCRYYYYSNSTCKPCKTATDELECSRCKRLNFFYNNATARCDYCQIASQSRCVQSNCPGYAYYNGSCRQAIYISNKSQCEKYPHFTFSEQRCNFCINASEYLDPFTKMCSKCQSFRNSSACSKCPHFFFDSKALSCKICKEASQQQCKSCYGYTFTNGSCKICQYLTSKNACDTCVDYFFVSQNCFKCQQAIEHDQCMNCRNFGWQRGSCQRCEKITDMVSCEKHCKIYGYYALYGKNLCLNCLHSSNKTTCDLCPSHYWSQTNNRCLSCSQTNQSCALCGGFMKSGYCQPCSVQNCKLCSTNGSSCLQCRASYTSQSLGTFCSKNCSAPYCSRCDDKSSTFCVQCKPDFLLSPLQGRCSIKCNVLNCLMCSSNSVCKQCSLGYISKNNGRSCECNRQNCLVCVYKNNITTCLSCIQGYQMNSTLNTCEKVKCLIDKCERCLSSQTCLQCQNGFRYVDVNVKAACIPICSIEGCSLCQTATSCHKCSINYKLLNDLSCEPNCKIQNCERCASQTTCRQCIGRYTKSIDQTRCQRKCEFLGLFILNNTCEPCQKIHANCHTCINKNQATLCTKCLPKYGLEMNSCINCAANIPYCISCRKNDISDFLCNQCQSGYSLINRECRKCSENCLKCARRGEMNCDTCIEGYVYVVQAINSHKCKLCLNQCKTCRADDIRECLTCFEGYFMNGTSCIKCSKNCLKCADEKTCQYCSHNSVMTPNGCADLSIPNCIEGSYVSQKLTCVNCIAGYEQKNGKCIDSNCSRLKNCKQCKSGNYIKNGQCLACPKIQGCQTCSKQDPTVCNICNAGFYLDQFLRCQLCVKGCSSCTSSVNCNIAAQGYYIEQFIRYPFSCSKNCLTCKGPYLCNSCVQGFAQYKTQCIREDSLILNITFQSIRSKNGKSTVDQKGISMRNWYNYYIQVVKLFSLESIEEEFLLDSIDVQHGKFGFVIDLSIQANKQKIISQINKNIIKRSQLFKILSLSIHSLNDSQKVQKQESSTKKQASSQSQNPSSSGTKILKSSTQSKSLKNFGLQIWGIIATILLVSAVVVIIILLRRRSRVIFNNNPEHPHQLDQVTRNCLQGKNYHPEEKNEKQTQGKSQSIEFKSEPREREQTSIV